MKNRAFTLVELSIVLVIIALLIGGISIGTRLISGSRQVAAQNMSDRSPIFEIFNSELEASVELWLDANDANTVKKDANGLVTEWRDKSKNERHALQATETNRPSAVSREFNGLTVIDFDGTDNYLSTQDTVLNPGSSDFSVFIVANFDSSGNSENLLSQQDGTGTGRAYLRDSGSNVIESGVGGVSTTAQAIVTSKYQIYSLTHDNSANEILIYTNNSSESASSIAAEQATGVLNIGAAKSATNFLDGTIGEIIIFDKVLNSQERKEIYNYLTTKWNLELT